MRPENYNSHSGRLSVTALCQVFPSKCNLYVGEAADVLFYTSFDTFPDAAPLNANAQFKNSFLINEPTLGPVPVQKRTHSKILSFLPRHTTSPWRATDGRAPEQMGQPGRPLSDRSGERGQKNPQVQKHAATNETQAATNTKNRIASFVAESSIGRTQLEYLSWVNHYQSKANCHEIPLLYPTMFVSRHSAWLQHLANGCPHWRKISGQPSPRPRCTISRAHRSALVTNGCEAKLTRRLARWSRSCNPIKAGASSAISCATASNRGGSKRSAPANARRPMSSAASSCSFRFRNNPHPADLKAELLLSQRKGH
jgi:hypothetical protein